MNKELEGYSINTKVGIERIDKLFNSIIIPFRYREEKAFKNGIDGLKYELKQALTRPLDSELEETINKLKEHKDMPQMQHNQNEANDLINTLRQALRLTPKITADEIVKELSDITGCQWEYIYIDMYYYGFGRGKFPEVGLIHNEFKNYHSRGVNLAHKITTFFTQESESE